MMGDMDQSLDEERLAFTRGRVSRLAGIDVEKLDYWDKTHLVGVAHRAHLSERNEVRLYGFADLLEVLIISELVRRGVSKRYVRDIVRHVRDLDYRMGELRWAIAGSRVHFQAPDGEWEDGERSQFVAAEVLDLDELRNRIRRSTEREDGTEGRIEKRRGALGSKPLVAGTRVPVATIEHYLREGFDTDRILASFPILSELDVEAVRRRAS